MGKLPPVSFAVVSLGLLSHVANAQETLQPIDIEQTMLSYFLTTSYAWPRDHGRAYIRNIQVLESNASELRVVEQAIPDTVLRDNYTFLNCSDQPITQRQTFTLNYKKDKTVTITRGFVGTSATNMSISGGVAMNMFKVNFETNQTNTTQISLTNGNSQAYSETVTEVEEKPIDIPAKTALTYTILRTLRHDNTYFKGTIRVRGEVWQSWGPHAPILMPQDITDTKVFPPERSSFPFEGVIFNVTSRDKKYVVKTQKLSDSSIECKSEPSVANQ